MNMYQLFIVMQKHYAIEPAHKDIKNLEGLSNVLSDSNRYDYIYFAGNGSGQCLGNNIELEITSY